MAFVTFGSGENARDINTDQITKMHRVRRRQDDGTFVIHWVLWFADGSTVELDETEGPQIGTGTTTVGTNVTVVNADTDPVPIHAPNPIGVTGDLGVARGSTAWAGQGTTAADAVLGTAWDKTGLKSTTLVIHNTGAASATVTVEGSVNGTDWDSIILGATAVAAGAKNTQHISSYFTHIRILVRSTTSTAPTTVAARAAAIAT